MYHVYLFLVLFVRIGVSVSANEDNIREYLLKYLFMVLCNWVHDLEIMFYKFPSVLCNLWVPMCFLIFFVSLIVESFCWYINIHFGEIEIIVRRIIELQYYWSLKFMRIRLKNDKVFNFFWKAWNSLWSSG